jgi:hypothetical protein
VTEHRLKEGIYVTKNKRIARIVWNYSQNSFAGELFNLEGEFTELMSYTSSGVALNPDNNEHFNIHSTLSHFISEQIEEVLERELKRPEVAKEVLKDKTIGQIVELFKSKEENR